MNDKAPAPTLALDSATPFLVLGLLGEQLALDVQIELGRAHAEQLAARIRDLLAQAGPDARVGHIVVGSGPGSYTGLRVGASYALGLGRALGVPVSGVSTLEGVAASRDGLVAASLDARKGSVYGGAYRVQGGVVVEVLVQAGKYPRGEFEGLVAGYQWLQDQPPSGLALARLAPTRGQRPFTLQYL